MSITEMSILLSFMAILPLPARERGLKQINKQT
jgi:hypothetical protein